MIKKKNFIFLVLILMLLSLNSCLFNNNNDNSNNDDKREITDMADRKVEVPKEIDKIFSILPSGSMFIYSIDPDLLVGWNYGFNDNEKAYILEDYLNLPTYGQGWEKVNKEAIIAAKPDIILAYGELIESEKNYADEFSSSTGLPVVMVDGSLSKAPEAYRFMGNLIGKTEKTESLAQYAELALQYAENIKNNQTTNDTIYYGDGPNSFKTAGIGDVRAELFDLLGANNVADLETNGTVDDERIIAWNPSIVILNGEPKGDNPKTPIEAVNDFKEKYTSVDAVKNNRVYGIPKYPFSWFDRPQSTNRLIGIYWLADIIYPDLEIDIEEKAIEFYQLFYHIDLTDEDLKIILYLNE
ncbi:MAG TPA: ABC transporter substrate-binding protein [Haloplasmataceae bacterium]